MPISLRPYQTQIIDKTRALMRQGCRSILIQAPCGAGKTALTAHMLHTAANKGLRCLFVVHRRELIKQSTQAFTLEGVEHGIISAGFIEKRQHRVQLASVQTLARRISRYPEPSLIVWDEAHHLAAGSWTRIFSLYRNAYHIGLTATPERLDGKGLSPYFREMVHGPSVSWLIENKFLSPYKLYAPSTVNLEGIHTRMGDYEQREMAAAVDKPSITGNAVEHYRTLAMGRRAVVFCASVQHSRHIVEEFIRSNIPAAHIDGETPGDERDEAIDRFKAGDLRILSNVEIFGEGFDVPAIEIAILLRPTQSLGYYLQQVGRALRPSPGKDQAIIFDHVGNYSRHGLPDDDRHWSLEGHAGASRKEGGPGITVKICPKCFAAQRTGQPSCRYCGFVFEVKPREIKEQEGHLEELNLKAYRDSRQEQGQAQTLEDLYRIGVSRKYRYPRRWAMHVFQARQAAKIGKVA